MCWFATMFESAHLFFKRQSKKIFGSNEFLASHMFYIKENERWIAYNNHLYYDLIIDSKPIDNNGYRNCIMNVIVYSHELESPSIIQSLLKQPCSIKIRRVYGNNDDYLIIDNAIISDKIYVISSGLVVEHSFTIQGNIK